MKIYIDIDDTICVYSKNSNGDYHQAIPSYNKIQLVNSLYEAGHIITFWTARGTVTGIDWFEITKQQLDSWGVKYHELILGKPAYDLLIDDKAMNSLEVLHFLTKLAEPSQ